MWELDWRGWDVQERTLEERPSAAIYTNQSSPTSVRSVPQPPELGGHCFSVLFPAGKLLGIILLSQALPNWLHGSVDALLSWLTEFLQPVPNHSGFYLLLFQVIYLHLFKITDSILPSWIVLLISLPTNPFWFIVNLAFLKHTVTLENIFSYRKIRIMCGV